MYNNSIVIKGQKDVHGTHIACCESIIQCLGLSTKNQLIGKNDFDVFPKKYALDFSQRDKLVYQQEGKWRGIERNFFKKIGECMVFVQKEKGFNPQLKIETVDYLAILYPESHLKSLVDLFKHYDLLAKDRSLDRLSLTLDNTQLSLTQREQQTLFFIAHGKTPQQIAEILGISKRTIDCYIAKLNEKLGCYNRVQLQEKAREIGFYAYFPPSLLKY